MALSSGKFISHLVEYFLAFGLEIPHTFILKTVISFYSHANVPAPDLHLCKGVLFCRRVIKYLFAHIPVLMCFLRAGAMKMQFRRDSNFPGTRRKSI